MATEHAPVRESDCGVRAQLGLAVSLGDVAIQRDQLHLLTQIHGRAVLLGIPREVGQPNRREGADSPNRGTKELSLAGEGGE